MSSSSTTTTTVPPPPIPLEPTSHPSSDDTKDDSELVTLTSLLAPPPPQVPSPSPPSPPPSEIGPEKKADPSPSSDRSESPGKPSSKKYNTKFCTGFKVQAKTLLKASRKMNASLKDFNDSLKGFVNSLTAFIPLLIKNTDDTQSLNSLIIHLRALSAGYDALVPEITDNFEKSLESFHDYFFNDLFELEKRKEKLRVESNYPNRKNMDKVRADFNNADKQFKNKYTEITNLLDPTFMSNILALSKAFIGMKDKYDTLSQLEVRTNALEKRLEESGNSTQKVTKEGYLNIKTKFSWQREYFVIRDGKLFHHSTGKATTPYVVTSVRTFSQKAAAMKFLDADRCIEVTCDKKKSAIVLQAQSKQDRDAWLSELTNIAVTASASLPASQSSPLMQAQQQQQFQQQLQQPQQQQQQQAGDGESQSIASSIFKRRTRFISMSGASTAPFMSGSKRRSKSPVELQSLSPADLQTSQLTWDELKSSDAVQKPISYTKRASYNKSDAKNIKLAGIPPWASSSTAKSTENAGRPSLCPPLMLNSFYKEFTYAESNRTAVNYAADRPEDSAIQMVQTPADTSDRNEDFYLHQERLRSYSCSSENSAAPPPVPPASSECFRAPVNVAASPLQQCASVSQSQGRKHTAMMRRKKTVDEAMDIPEEFAIDTDKVTEGLAFTELVGKLTETDKTVAFIEAELCPKLGDDLEKLNDAMNTLHNVKGHLTFMSDEQFVPATTADDAKKLIIETAAELKDIIKDIASSLDLVVPDNSSSWAFYVQPIGDAYTSIQKYISIAK